MKKILSAFLSFLFVFLGFNVHSTVFANDTQDLVSPEIVEEYNNIDTITASISTSGITATLHATLLSKSSNSLKFTMYWDRKGTDGYTTLKYWTYKKTGVNLSATEKVTYNPLKDYRLRVVYTDGSESATLTKYLT